MEQIEIPKEIVRLDKATNKLHVNIWPKQQMFLSSECDELLFGGAAGGGKDSLLVTVDNATKLGYNPKNSKSWEDFKMKCGSHVMTPFGFKLIDDIQVGDAVCNPDGTTVKVIAVQKPVNQTCYRVTFVDGASVICGEGHLWSVKIASQRTRRKVQNPYDLSKCVDDQDRFNSELCCRYKTVTTVRLAELHVRALDDEKKGNRPRWVLTPLTEPVNFQGSSGKCVMVSAYTLGVLLGDGSISQDNVRWSKPDKFIAEEVKKDLKNFGSFDEVHALERGTYSIVGGEVRTSLQSLKLSGCRSWEKFIPVQFKNGPLEMRWNLVQGLMDTDGYADPRGQCYFTSTSFQMAKDMQYMVRSLGFIATITVKEKPAYTYKGETKVGRQAYNVYITGRNRSKLFRLPRKKDRVKDILTEGGRRVVKVEKLEGAFDTKCITVSHPNGLYITNDFIVTHNSIALLLFALKRRMEHPGTLGVTFRRKFPDLERSLILASRGVFPKVGAKYNSTKHEWVFPNGSRQLFGFCDRDSSVYDHQGAEYHDIGFDEATHFSYFMFSYLTSRCRSAIPGVKPLIRLASNPGGVGHLWCKKRYVDPGRMQKKWYVPEEKKELGFIPSLLEDNPALHKNDPTYEHRLRILGEKKFKALRYGDWEVFEGQFFDEWDDRPGYSVLTKDRVPDSHTIKVIGMDWGYAAPACVLWLEITPSGRVFVYRELYTTRRSPTELAQDILTLSPRNEEYKCLYAPPEIWGKEIEKDGGGEPIQSLMQAVLKNRVVMEKANNARVPGWMKLRQYLSKAPDGLPWLQISPSCKNLIRTLPAMIHDELHPEDLDSDADDHGVDSLRYSVVGLNEIPQTIMMPQGVVQGFDKVFGTKESLSEIYSAPHIPGRGGY